MDHPNRVALAVFAIGTVQAIALLIFIALVEARRWTARPGRR